MAQIGQCPISNHRLVVKNKLSIADEVVIVTMKDDVLVNML